MEARPPAGVEAPDPFLGAPKPLGPEVDPRRGVGRMVVLLAKLHLRRTRVTSVAHRVNEARLGEDLGQLGRARDREAAHLDQRRLGRRLGERAQQVVEQVARGANRVARNGPLEPRDRGAESLLGDDLVEAADPAARLTRAKPRSGSPERHPGAPDHPRGHQGSPADPDPVPPVGPELSNELLGRGAAADQVGEALRVAVEAALDRHPAKARMMIEQVRDHGRPAAPGAPDEDEPGGFAHVLAPTGFPSPPRKASGRPRAAGAACDRSSVPRRSGVHPIPSASKRSMIST